MNIEIDRDKFYDFLQIVKQVRSGFLFNAPRFASGSTAEALAHQAIEMSKFIEEYEQLTRKGKE